MSHRTAAWLVTGTHHLAERVRRADAEQGQGTVEYAGLAMAIGVLLLAVGSYLGRYWPNLTSCRIIRATARGGNYGAGHGRVHQGVKDEWAQG
jgi:hypothetical protein